jgi:hypothetical protein
MQGIVSQLDHEHTRAVQDLWAGLEKQFGLHGVQEFPYPHISYAIIDGHDPDAVLRRMEKLVSQLHPFTIRTAGIGIFNKPAPVVYLPVVRSPELARLHRLVWRTFPLKAASAGFYAVEHWIPHITLASGDLDDKLLPEVTAFLAGYDLHWEVLIDNLAFAVQVGEGFELRCGCKFLGD